MKIIWLSHVLSYPPLGGVTQRSYHLIKQLAAHHELTLLSFNQRAIRKTQDEIDTAVQHFQGFCKAVHVVPIPSEFSQTQKIRVLLSSILTLKPYTIRWLGSTQMASLLETTLGQEEFDLVFFDTISLWPYFQNLTNQATILDHHNIESDMLFRRIGKEKNWLRKAYFAWEAIRLRSYENRACPLFDRNVTCSSLDATRLLDRLPGLKVSAVPNGVDLDYFRSSPPSADARHLIFVGSMNWYPNVDAMRYFLEQIWGRLKSSIPAITMTVVGGNPPEFLIKASEQDSQLTVTGFVDDVRPFMDRAGIYLCPIRDGGGTKLKILNALAMGKAIVADPIACEGIDVEEGRSVLFASRPELYVKAVERLIDDGPLRRRLETEGRHLAEARYGYDNIGIMLSDTCEEALRDHGTRRNSEGLLQRMP
jgi:glycosyltransferase involved in cell wall biosynthesis